jgi:DnaK suppressor protein
MAQRKTAKKKTSAKKSPKKKVAAKTARKAVKKAAPKKTVKKTAAKKTVKKAATKTAPKKAPKKAAPKKTVKKAAAKAAPKKPPKKAVKKTAAKKAPARKLSPRERRILMIRETLLEQKNELLHEAENAMNSLPEQTVFPDLGDQASAETDRNFMLRLKGREQRLLNKIEEAMERIDGGTYGACDSCGEEITIQRLEARPVTTLCIECKTEQEEEEKLLAG